MTYLFEIADKTGRKIHLTRERWKHIQKHPHMHDQEEKIQEVLQNPTTIRQFLENEQVMHFYKAYKQHDPSERYLLVSVKYLNGKGFIITSFFTNKITGQRWKVK